MFGVKPPRQVFDNDVEGNRVSTIEIYYPDGDTIYETCVFFTNGTSRVLNRCVSYEAASSEHLEIMAKIISGEIVAKPYSV